MNKYRIHNNILTISLNNHNQLKAEFILDYEECRQYDDTWEAMVEFDEITKHHDYIELACSVNKVLHPTYRIAIFHKGKRWWYNGKTYSY